MLSDDVLSSTPINKRPATSEQELSTVRTVQRETVLNLQDSLLESGPSIVLDQLLQPVLTAEASKFPESRHHTEVEDPCLHPVIDSHEDDGEGSSDKIRGLSVSEEDTMFEMNCPKKFLNFLRSIESDTIKYASLRNYDQKTLTNSRLRKLYGYILFRNTSVRRADFEVRISLPLELFQYVMFLTKDLISEPRVPGG